MSEQRLIDANELMNRMNYKKCSVADKTYTEGFNDAIGRIRSMIHSAPTIEAEPVRHGRWGVAEIVGYNGYHAIYARPCTLCCEYTREYKPPYCPNCGAKMEKT